MPPSRSTPPWVGYSFLALALLPSAIRAEAITEGIVTPLGDTASLTHSHPAFGGLLRGKVVKPVMLTEKSGKGVRNLEAALSDVSRLEAFFGTPMECNYNVLKDSYSSAECDVLPWSGGYWPTYQDGINVVWKDGEPSPAEKYATAYGIDVDAFKNGISLSTGVLSESYTGSATCTDDSGCGDGSLCGIRGGESSGYCIPTWYGMCHAWAAAAIYEAEPKCDVERNNVTFHPVDMKALISQAYDGAAIDVVFTGARFNGPDSPEEVDQYGRYEDDARRDINAAFFHIAMANILGKQHHSFIVDVSADSPVWNQPVQKYEILETAIVDAATLSAEYFDSKTYPFNDAATYLAKCTTRLTWTAESMEDGALTTTGRIAEYTVWEDYEYCLELDEDYTIIGGEWLGDSRKDHPDFLWFPATKPSADTVTDTGISYADVVGMIEESLQCVDVTISPDVPDTPSTKTPGTTKSPSYTKTPSTKTPSTKTPATKAPVTNAPETTVPPTYYPESTAPVSQYPTEYPTKYPESTAPVSQYPTEYPTEYPESTAPVSQYPTEYPTKYPESTAPVSQYPTEYPSEYPTEYPETTAPSTYSPNTTEPVPYTPQPGLICYEDTPAPTTEVPTYTPEVTTPPMTEVPTYTPEVTMPPTTEVPTYTPEVTTPPMTEVPTYAPTYVPTVAPTPNQGQNQSQNKGGNKWSLWW